MTSRDKVEFLLDLLIEVRKEEMDHDKKIDTIIQPKRTHNVFDFQLSNMEDEFKERVYNLIEALYLMQYHKRIMINNNTWNDKIYYRIHEGMLLVKYRLDNPSYIWEKSIYNDCSIRPAVNDHWKILRPDHSEYVNPF